MSLEASLLPEEECVDAEGCQQGISPRGERNVQCRTCSINGGTANIILTAVGAGMLALPRAFSTVGIGTGLVLFLMVSAITSFSAASIIKYALRDGKPSYGQLIHHQFGPLGALALQTSVCIHVFGVMVVYIIIISDIMVGSAPEWHGIIPTLLDIHDGPWWLSRLVVSAALVLGLIVPMLLPRSLTVVARFSRVTVVLVLAIAMLMSSLAGLALSQGKASRDIRFWPHAEPGVGAFNMLTDILAVISVSCLAYTCHFNLIPIQNSLKNSSYGAMLKVIIRGIGSCTLFYGLVACSGYILFGSETQGDVLVNLSISFTSTLVPPLAARTIISVIGIFYVCCLCVNFVLKVWALRDAISEMSFGKSPTDLSTAGFYTLTFSLVGAAYVVAATLTGIWTVISVTGSTACVVFSFWFPGALVIKNNRGSLGYVAAATGVIVLGALTACITVFDVLSGRSGR